MNTKAILGSLLFQITLASQNTRTCYHITAPTPTVDDAQVLNGDGLAASRGSML